MLDFLTGQMLKPGINHQLRTGGFGVVVGHLGIAPAKDRHQLQLRGSGLSEQRC